MPISCHVILYLQECVATKATEDTLEWAGRGDRAYRDHQVSRNSSLPREHLFHSHLMKYYNLRIYESVYDITVRVDVVQRCQDQNKVHRVLVLTVV